MTKTVLLKKNETLAVLKEETMDWLKQALFLEEYDYRELSELLGMSRTTIIRWLKAKQFPRPDKFKDLALLITENIADEDVFKKSSLGGKLFLLRNFEGLTINEMSDGAMVNVNLLRRWESGTETPDENQIRRLMQYFDVSAENLGVDVQGVTLGSYIQEERMALEITQDELGLMLGKSSTIISNYENSRRLPTPDDLIKLAEIFEVSVESFLFATEESVSGKYAHICS